MHHAAGAGARLATAVSWWRENEHDKPGPGGRGQDGSTVGPTV